MTLLIILIVLTALSIVGVIIGFATNDSDIAGSFIVITLLIGAFGWGFIGTMASTRIDNKPITNFKYSQTPSATLVEADGMTRTFLDASTYNSIRNAKQIYERKSYNMYGSEIATWITLDPDGGKY